MIINKYKLKQTCEACPEQYDVFKDGEQVGYLRLRHGYFRADMPKCGGKTVYEAWPKGNQMGIFYDDNERMRYLTAAIEAIDRILEEKKE